MKVTRVIFAALALAVAAACSATDITAPNASADGAQVQAGFIGSGT
jgi:hypothetical protein